MALSWLSKEDFYLNGTIVLIVPCFPKGKNCETNCGSLGFLQKRTSYELALIVECVANLNPISIIGKALT